MYLVETRARCRDVHAAGTTLRFSVLPRPRLNILFCPKRVDKEALTHCDTSPKNYSELAG
jgi:hypothetical protein